MSDFQSQLDDELEKRGLTQKAAEKAKPNKKKKEKKKKKKKEKVKKVQPAKSALPFSFLSFGIALLLCLIVSGGFIAWAFINAEATADKATAKLPTKTAIVSKQNDINIEDVQPILRMQPVEQEGAESDTKSDNKPSETVKPAPEKTTQDDDRIAPFLGLFENSDLGSIPIINKDNGLTPFQAYKKQASKAPEKPSISFIVTDMGTNNKRTTQLIEELPDSITFAFSPYAWNVKALMLEAQRKQHETWLTLPLQTKNYPIQDPGPLAILSGANIRQNQQRLNTLMGKAVGYAGFIAGTDHIFRTEDARTNPSFKEIFDRGLAIIDSNNQGVNFVNQLAEKEGRPYGQNNFWLDENLNSLALNQKLRQALEFSRNTKSVTVMLRPYPISIETLKKFLNSVAAKEFNIVPASALVRDDG